MDEERKGKREERIGKERGEIVREKDIEKEEERERGEVDREREGKEEWQRQRERKRERERERERESVCVSVRERMPRYVSGDDVKGFELGNKKIHNLQNLTA